jgi:hypothetical protein
MSELLLFLSSNPMPAVSDHLWQSTVFAATVWLMTMAMRRKLAEVRYALWLAASVKFLIPFSLLVWLGGLFSGLQHAPVGPQPTFFAAVSTAVLPFSEGAMASSYLAGQPARPERRIDGRGPLTLAFLWLGGVAASTCEVPEPEPGMAEDFPGVDFGVKTFAATSDGKKLSGRKVNKIRYR